MFVETLNRSFSCLQLFVLTIIFMTATRLRKIRVASGTAGEGVMGASGPNSRCKKSQIYMNKCMKYIRPKDPKVQRGQNYVQDR